MADQLPDLAPTPGGRWPRRWHEYANYQVVHDRHIEALVDEGVISEHQLSFIGIVDASGETIRVNLRGRLQTGCGGVVIVNKWLAVRRGRANRLEVVTSEYDYHAFTRHPVRMDLFRDDSCHGLDTLHRHCFDTDGVEADHTQPVELERMPPLSEVIREADALARWLADYHRPA